MFSLTFLQELTLFMIEEYMKTREIITEIKVLLNEIENQENNDTKRYKEFGEKIVKLARTIKDKNYEMKGLYQIAKFHFRNQNTEDCKKYLELIVLDKQMPHNDQYVLAVRNLGHCNWKSGDLNKAIELFEKTIELNKHMKKFEEIPQDLINIGALYQQKDEYETSIEYASRALEIFTKNKNNKGIGFAIGNLGVNYFKLGDYQKSLEYLHKSATFAEERKDQESLARTLNSIAMCYLKLGLFEKAVEFIQRTICIKEEMNADLLINITNMGVIYNECGNQEMALKYYEKALSIAQKKNNKLQISILLNNIANIYKDNGKHDLALEKYEESLKLRQLINDRNGEVHGYCNIALFYYEIKKDLNKAITLYKIALNKAKKIKMMDSVFSSSLKLAKIYFELNDLENVEKYIKPFETATPESYDTKMNYLDLNIQILKHKGHYQKAFELIEELIRLKESILNESQQRTINEMQIRFETERKEKEADFFRQKSEELEKKNKLIETQKKKLESTIEKLRKSEIKYDVIEEELHKTVGLELIGASEELKNIKKLIRVVANADNTNVLIIGENGTGKEIVARQIHNFSKRVKNNFYSVNSSAIPETLFESEFFGYEKNAFTGANKSHIGWFEIADKGTLFLDEIGTMQENRQVKLLRVLEERKVVRLGSHKELPVNVRVISATNANLYELVQNGDFREDLYHRISTFVIQIPPLRQRKDDIPLLLEHFVKMFALQTNKKIKRIEKRVTEILLNYQFPGNVRELKNLVERAVIVSDSSSLKVNHFSIPNCNCNQKIDQIIPLEQMEKEHIIKALRMTGFHQKKAAELLRVDRKVIARRIQKFNISKESIEH